MMIYSSETPELTPEQKQHAMEAHWALIDEAKRLGIFHASEPLAPSSSATSVRVRDGKVMMTDGPFAETKEQLGGFYILECKDLDEALAWAARIPICHGPGGIEVRPMPGLPARDETPQPAAVAETR
jgi:hypothetical protein